MLTGAYDSIINRLGWECSARRFACGARSNADSLRHLHPPVCRTHSDLSSCQVQFDLCYAFVPSQRSLGYVVVEERFDDEGYTGTTLDRPALHRLLIVIRSGGVEQLVIHRLDRLSRNPRHFVTLFEDLRDHNVTLEIVTAQGLGEAALDKFMLSILASFAEFERDLAASRIAEARAHLKAHERRIAGAVPFGSSLQFFRRLVSVPNELKGTTSRGASGSACRRL